jgi:hypothetical protein
MPALIKLQMLMMLSFTFEIFVEILSPIVMLQNNSWNIILKKYCEYEPWCGLLQIAPILFKYGQKHEGWSHEKFTFFCRQQLSSAANPIKLFIAVIYGFL